MMRCLIISGGEYSKVTLNKKYDLIIACDKGYTYAKKLKLKPDIVVGDFDSSKVPHAKVSIIEVSREKDDTDTGLAIKYALRNGYKEIDIVCALGERIDHTIANISLLKYMVERDVKGRILSSDACIFAAGKGIHKIERKANHYLSIFSLSDKSRIEYIKNAKYEVENIVLKNSFSLGISNEFKNKFAYVKVNSGFVLVCVVKKS